MIEDRFAGKIDLILTKSIIRFARNTVDFLKIIRELKERQVCNRIKQVLNNQVAAMDERFANGRLVRNIYDDLIMNHAKRVVDFYELNHEILSLITAEDFMEFNTF